MPIDSFTPTSVKTTSISEEAAVLNKSKETEVSPVDVERQKREDNYLRKYLLREFEGRNGHYSMSEARPVAQELISTGEITLEEALIELEALQKDEFEGIVGGLRRIQEEKLAKNESDVQKERMKLFLRLKSDISYHLRQGGSHEVVQFGSVKISIFRDPKYKYIIADNVDEALLEKIRDKDIVSYTGPGTPISFHSLAAQIVQTDYPELFKDIKLK